jgi:secreted PhoX family phosphatase
MHQRLQLQRGRYLSVAVAFAPLAPGQRLGAVQLLSNSVGVVATALLSGTGTGPAVVFPASTGTRTLGSYPGVDGMAVDASGNVYVADATNHVTQIEAVGGSIPATNPTTKTLGFGFKNPGNLAVDGAGNVYVADAGNNAVKEIVAVGGVIPASNPTILTLGSGFSYPDDVKVDGAGNVFVLDEDHELVKEIVAVNGTIPATSPTIRTLGSGFKNPTGIAVDAAGNVYVTDRFYSAVKEMLAVNGSIPATNPTIRTLGATIANLQTLAVDAAGDVYVLGAGVVELVDPARDAAQPELCKHGRRRHQHRQPAERDGAEHRQHRADLPCTVGGGQPGVRHAELFAGERRRDNLPAADLFLLKPGADAGHGCELHLRIHVRAHGGRNPG